jgi:hypothetical protein
MRLILNLFSREAQESPAATPISALRVSLGDPALQVALGIYSLRPLLDDDGALITPAQLQFAAKHIGEAGTVFSSTAAVSGSVDIETVAAGAVGQVLSCGEDWKAAALVALFDPVDTEKVTVRGQFRWRNGGETEWTKSRLFKINVENSLFTDDFVPGATPVLGGYLWLPLIDSLTGSDTSLDQVAIAGLPDRTLIKISIEGEGTSEWLKEEWTDVAAPVTGDGIIVPPDFDSATMSYVLVKQ